MCSQPWLVVLSTIIEHFEFYQHLISSKLTEQKQDELNIYYDIPACQCVYIKTNQVGKQESDGSKNASHNMTYLYEACDQTSDFCHQ